MVLERRLVLALALAVAGLVLAAPVVRADPRPGFRIGTVPNGTDVVNNGVVQGGWSQLQPQHLLQNEALLYLYLGINATEVPDGDDLTQGFAAEVEVGHAVYDLNIVPGSGRAGSHYEDQVQMELEFVCKENGTGVAVITIALEPFDEVTLVVYKTCADGDPRVGFMVSTTGGGEPNVVKDGELVPQYADFVSSVADSSTTFTAFLELTIDREQTQPFEVKNLAYDSLVMRPSIAYPGALVARTLTDHLSPARFIVTYNCLDNLKGKHPKQTSISFTIVFPLGAEGSDPLIVSYDKECPTTGDHGGWSPVGVFFFVVFLITLVVCVSGCSYNYFARHQRGADIVPGMPIYRACYEKARGGGVRHTPQMDVDDDIGVSAGAGGGGGGGGAGGYGAVDAEL